MGVEIHLENNHFPWKNFEEKDCVCWVKGDLFYNEETLHGSAIFSLISTLRDSFTDDSEELINLLRAFNGSFAFVMKTPNSILCVVDRLRSIPLFYAKTDTGLTISDDANHLKDKINPIFDEINGGEFLLTGYVTGPETLFEDIYQIQAGEFLAYEMGTECILTSFYHHFWHENYYSDSEEGLLDRLDAVFTRVFERLIASINEQDLRIVVPLSGGLDSRIIVSLLKRLGVDDVICFSYGRKGNRQAKISKKVAETLGYQWYFVDYSKENCDTAQSQIIKDYQRYAGNLTSDPHLQDFFAVKKLQEEGKIPENAIFLPGHSGDMLAGSHIPLVTGPSQDFSEITFIQHILKKNYCLWDWNDKSQLYPILKEKIERASPDVEILDRETWANAIEYWDYQERQAKFIVNSVRVYEFFGYSWRLPLWDSELMDFFLRISLPYRKNTKLYRKYAVEKLFVDSLRDVGRIDCTTPLSDNSKMINLSKKIVIAVRDELNFLANISSFNIEWAVLWSSKSQNPGLVKIRQKLFGYDYYSYHNHKWINDIIVYSQSTGFIPPINGIGTIDFLIQTIGEEDMYYV